MHHSLILTPVQFLEINQWEQHSLVTEETAFKKKCCFVLLSKLLYSNLIVNSFFCVCFFSTVYRFLYITRKGEHQNDSAQDVASTVFQKKPLKVLT